MKSILIVASILWLIGISLTLIFMPNVDWLVAIIVWTLTSSVMSLVWFFPPEDRTIINDPNWIVDIEIREKRRKK